VMEVGENYIMRSFIAYRFLVGMQEGKRSL
jgi:hypothetical protein